MCLSWARAFTVPGWEVLSVDATGNDVVSQAGVVILLRTAETTGLVVALSEALFERDCLADVGVLCEPRAYLAVLPRTDRGTADRHPR